MSGEPSPPFPPEARRVDWSHAGKLRIRAIPQGNSSSVKVGNPVVAMGNAEGRGAITAKPGQVTALNETITVSDDGGSTASETLHGVIQTNTADPPQ
jgi:S1-C subfamily serine protease